LVSKPKRTTAYAFRFIFAILHAVVPFVDMMETPVSCLTAHLILSTCVVLIDISAHTKVSDTSRKSSVEVREDLSMVMNAPLITLNRQSSTFNMLFSEPNADPSTYAQDSSDDEDDVTSVGSYEKMDTQEIKFDEVEENGSERETVNRTSELRGHMIDHSMGVSWRVKKKKGRVCEVEEEEEPVEEENSNDDQPSENMILSYKNSNDLSEHLL